MDKLTLQLQEKVRELRREVRRLAREDKVNHELDIAIAQAKAIREKLSYVKPNHVSAIHSHYCKHCDRSYQDYCKDNTYEISNVHDCRAHYRNTLRVKRILNPDRCAHGCSLVNCAHVQIETKSRPPGYEVWLEWIHELFFDFYDDDNAKTSACLEDLLEGKAKATPKPTEPSPGVDSNFKTRYTIDAVISSEEVSRVRKAWRTAKTERVGDWFTDTPWLVRLAKEFRQA